MSTYTIRRSDGTVIEVDAEAFDARRPETDPVPQTVSRFQARAALLAAGKLDTVEAAVAEADAFTKLAWNEATEWNRDSAVLNALATTIGMTDAQIDDLFRQAELIEA